MPDSPPAEAPPARARSFTSVADLIDGATERTVLAGVPGKSGARMERVTIGGQR
jgi:hypothetical protein